VAIRAGGTPPKSVPSFWQGDIPWISPKDMKSPDLIDAFDHISVEATELTSAKLHQPGAMLIVVCGMILAHTVPVATLSVPAAINQDIKAMYRSSSIYLRSFSKAPSRR
jgi:type I restriction enzyme S subunit